MVQNIILQYKIDSNTVDLFIKCRLKLLDLKSKLLI